MNLRTRFLPLFLLCVGLLWLFSGAAQAQYFGKNKINFDLFHWKHFRTAHFDIYYYDEEAALVPSVAEQLEAAYGYLRELLKHDLSDPVPVVLYQNHRHFEQTNIIPDFIPEGVGGFTEITQHRLVIPIDGARSDLQKLITHELTHAFQYDILFNFNIFALGVSNVPQWLMEGMAEFTADDASAVGNMVLRDAVVSEVVPPIRYLDDFDLLPNPYLGYKLGHHLCAYLVDKYGMAAFRSFLWEIKKNIYSFRQDRAALEVFGQKMEDLGDTWKKELTRETYEWLGQTEDPAHAYGQELGETHKYYSNFSPRLSPSGDLMAYFSTYRDRVDLFVSLSRPPTHKEEMKGFGARNLYSMTSQYGPHSYHAVVTDGHPLAWSANGDLLAMFVRKARRRTLVILDALQGKISQEINITLEDVSSPSWNPDGSRIAFAGADHGQPDIFSIEVATGKLAHLTDDEAMDSEPAWSPNGDSVVYASERNGLFRLYQVRVNGVVDPDPRPLTAGSGNDISPTWAPDGKSLVFVSDRCGLTNNLYRLDLKNGEERQLTNVFTGVAHPEVSPDGSRVLFSTFYELSYHIHATPLSLPEPMIEGPIAGSETYATNRTIPPHPNPLPEDEGTEPAQAGMPMLPEQQTTTGGTTALPTTQDAHPPALPQGEKEQEDTYQPPKFKEYPLFQAAPQGLKPSFRLYPDGIPAIRVAYRSDGVFWGDMFASFTDLLGNHRLILLAGTVDGVESFAAGYAYLRHRWDLGATVGRAVNLLYIDGRRTQETATGAMVEFQYPIHTFYRVELSLSGERYTVNPRWWSDYTSVAGGISFVGDSVRYRYFGPYQGHRFQVGVERSIAALGDLDYVSYSLDYRGYLGLTKRSLFALRLAAIYSYGADERLYSIGGAGTIRGYDFGAFTDNKVAFGNLEFRFPLIDRLLVFGFLPLGDFRGHLFADAGTAWRDDSGLDLWGRPAASSPPQFLDLHASLGAGFSWSLGAFDLMFEFSKRTNGRRLLPDTIFEFWIGRKF